MTLGSIIVLCCHIAVGNSFAVSTIRKSSRLLKASTLETEEATIVHDISKGTSLSETQGIDLNNSQSLLPGKREDSLFKCDQSVHFWKSFESKGNPANFQRLIETVSAKATSSSVARAYWMSQLLRSGYFTANAALGSFASDMYERLVERGFRGSGYDARSRTSPILSRQSSSGSILTGLFNSDIPSRLLLEAITVYEQDFNYVEANLLKFPWDGLLREDKIQYDHRQANPIFILGESVRTIRESVEIFNRRNKKSSPGVVISKSDVTYPEYYQNDFHYQTDGWMSKASAQRYEASTETLFLGRQDAMQRQTLIPMLKKKESPKSILDVACGTGRLGTFIRDNFPQAHVTYSDLSPFYLEKAKSNDNYWISYRGEEAMGEATGERKNPRHANFVQANAESLPFNDNSFDAVTCVYLFHELPEDARLRAAKEMVRVVKPGGMIVLTDSVQLGDRPPLDESLNGFSNLNEPYYKNYLNTYLPDLFQGCKYGEKYVASTTKTLSFIKKSA